MSATTADLVQRLAEVQNYRALEMGGQSVGLLTAQLLNYACAEACGDASALMRLLAPCPHGTVLVGQVCQSLGLTPPPFGDSSTLFFSLVFICIAGLLLVLVGLLFWKLRGRRLS